ncbi:MAG: hypothetical protein ACXV9R_10345 [Methylobacter sp.]
MKSSTCSDNGHLPGQGGVMNIIPLTQIDQIKQDDLLLISDSREVQLVKAVIVKVTEYDGTEVIYNKKMNHYFNVGMYLEGKSRLKDVRIVTP